MGDADNSEEELGQVLGEASRHGTIVKGLVSRGQCRQMGGAPGYKESVPEREYRREQPGGV